MGISWRIKMNTFAFTLLCLFGVVASASRLADRIGAKNCTGVDGCCKIDEGDCDSHEDCCSGLKCNYDWGFATDLCEAGPTTKDFSWGDWSEWSAQRTLTSNGSHVGSHAGLTSLSGASAKELFA